MECRSKILLKTGLIVPCGKCPICLANRRQEWVFRLRVEHEQCVWSCFVTLTYDDEHLPGDYSVHKRDVQLFLKRLRKKKHKFRYFVVAEYGDHTHRPHYHGLFFFDYSPSPSIYDDITNAWSNGFIRFGDVEEGSIVYCTKYCLKGCTLLPGQNDVFILCSKQNGGIGYAYLQSMANYHLEQNNYEYVSLHGLQCRMPKYYKDKLYPVAKNLDPEFCEERQQRFIDRAYTSHYDKFKEFLQGKHFDSLEVAQMAFNAEMVRRGLAKETLIVNHTKKQKF